MPGLSSGQFATLNLPSLNGEMLVPEYNASGHGGFSLLAQGMTGTGLASSANPSYPGQSVTFTATVMSFAGATPTGTVQFFDGQTLLGSGALAAGQYGRQATFTVSGLSLGSHSITAVYGGDGSFQGSTSSALTQTVQLASTYSSVASSVNPSTPGQSVTFTATVGGGGVTPTGTVKIMDGQTLLGTATLMGNGMYAQATFSTSALSLGSHSITAVYVGDAAHAGSTSSVLTQVVQAVQMSMTFTSLSASADPSPYGQPVTFTAHVTAMGAPTGTISFYDGTTLLRTVNLSNGTAAFTIATLTRGSHSITAVYGGDAGDLGSTSSVVYEMIM